MQIARPWRGATSPNPPVGAVALTQDGRVLGMAAHKKSGEPHAEAQVLRICREQGTLSQVHTLVVTLEPCNHQGKTPPCTESILQAGVKHVVFGSRDPNPKVKGGGAERLREAGIQVTEGILLLPCEELIRPFAHWVRTGRPWVTLKTAWRKEGQGINPQRMTMIPPQGQRTFTSPDSLRLAHELRKRADAILTGSGTVLIDQPQFTVRQVPDHLGKKRWLILLDRRRRINKDWIQDRENTGFNILLMDDVETALTLLGQKGCLEVLVEAGPSLSGFFLEKSLWNEHILILQGDPPGSPDTVESRINCLSTAS